jgi:hypothetical protein
MNFLVFHQVYSKKSSTLIEAVLKREVILKSGYLNQGGLSLDSALRSFCSISSLQQGTILAS